MLRALLLTVLAALLAACSDRTVSLRHGYFYREEGGDMADILCERAGCGIVPATVTAYEHDGDFIVAKQRPMLPPPYYDEEEPVYEDPSDEYYWIVVYRDDSIVGPLSKAEYMVARAKYGVPDDLGLE